MKNNLKVIEKDGYNYICLVNESKIPQKFKLGINCNVKELEIEADYLCELNEGYINKVYVPNSNIRKQSVNPEILNKKKYLSYNELLKLAHNNKLQKLEILDHYINFDSSCCWCLVRATFPDDKIYEGLGSSTSNNTIKEMQKNFIEIAHTRAKIRALKDALNIEIETEEEKDEIKQNKKEDSIIDL